MSKILLVRPPFYSVFGTETKVGNIPLGLLYIASSLEREGYHVEVLDCETLDFGEKTDTGTMRLMHQMRLSYPRYERVMQDKKHPVWKEVTQHILDANPDLIGFTAQTAAMSSVIYISAILREQTSTPIILGGSHPTVMPELSLKETGADAVVIGEGEKTVTELVPPLLEGDSLKGIRGIAYAYHYFDKWSPPFCRRYIRNEARKRIQNLDQLSFPARHLLNRSLYKTSAFGYITSERGCPFNCLFCTSRTIWGRQAIFRSITSILDEIEEVQSTYGTKHFRFADDTFTLNKKRVLEFCRKIADRKLDITFRCPSRADSVDREMLHALKMAGCNRTSFGVESGSQRILDLIGKRSTVQKARDAISMAKEEGLNTIATFIIGHPTETLEDIHATVNLIEEIRPHRTIVNLMSIYPGCALYEETQSKEWWRYYFHGKSVKSVSALSEKELDVVFKEVSELVMRQNLGEPIKGIPA